MKVLFLDIDGVANCRSTSQRHRGYIGIDPLMAFRIGKILLDTEAVMVLSSTWRLWPETRLEVSRQISKIHDVTPDLRGDFRGAEVKAWLKDHPEIERYAILDDNSDFYPDQPLFKTKWETGITEEIAKQVTDYLNDVQKVSRLDGDSGSASEE